MYINHKVLKTNSIAKRYRRISAKKIFVGKGELKHTNSKVIITFYVYNTEKLSLKREYKKLYNSLYTTKYLPQNLKGTNIKSTQYKEIPLIKYIDIDKNGDIYKNEEGEDIIRYNRPYTLKEFFGSYNYKTIITQKILKEERPEINKIFNVKEINPMSQITYYEIYYSIAIFFIDRLTTYLEVLIKYYEYLTKLVELKVLNDHEKFLIFIKKASCFYPYEYPKSSFYMEIANDNYKTTLYRLRYLLKFNSVKFEKPFIVKLRHLVEKFYNKKIEFNIVNLKKMHLNSDIFTQAIILKLKRKNNLIFRVLKSSLNKVKLPNVSRLTEKFNRSNKNEYLVNNIRNTYINSMLNNDNTKIDSLNNLLLNFFPSADNLKVNEKKLPGVKHTISLRNYIFRNLKHFKLAGVRVEAKGRLSRRFTAARSVFKLEWKGGLKNVDSSFKGLSTVMLRGDSRSNVQYSMLKSKNRIGAFGIKGWVSNK